MKHLSEFFYSPAVFRKEISILRSFWLQVYLELMPTQMAAVSFNLGVRDVQWKWWSGEFSVSPDEETQSYQGEGKRCCVRFLPHNSFSHLKRVLILQWWALVAALWNICLQCCNFPTEFRVLEAWHRRDGQGTDNALKFCVFSWATSPDLYPGDL